MVASGPFLAREARIRPGSGPAREGGLEIRVERMFDLGMRDLGEERSPALVTFLGTGKRSGIEVALLYAHGGVAFRHLCARMLQRWGCC